MLKYGNKKTEVNGILFASKKEALRYQELTLLQRDGEISSLQLQPRFPLVVNGEKVATYIADFQYIDNKTGEEKVEDVKGIATPVYKLKAKLVKAIYGIDIIET